MVVSKGESLSVWHCQSVSSCVRKIAYSRTPPPTLVQRNIRSCYDIVTVSVRVGSERLAQVLLP